RLAATGAPLRARTAGVWFALLLLGTTFFGIGIGVALAFPLALFLLLPDAWRRRALRAAVLALPAATLVLYFGLRWVANRVEPFPVEEMVQQALNRSGFDAVPPMLAQLLAFSMAGTILDSFLPATYPDAASVIGIAAFGAGLAVAAWRADWPARRAMLAMLVLAGGISLVIALGRAHTYQLFHFPTARAASASPYHYTR